MRLIPVLSFFVFFFYLCHESSSTAEHNQFNMTTNPEFAKNIFSEHFIYKYFKRIFDFLQKLTAEEKNQFEQITTTETIQDDSRVTQAPSEKSISQLPFVKNLTELLMTDGADVCHSSIKTKKINMLVLVDSFAKNLKERKRIRDTWYNYWASQVQNVQIVFFVGKPEDTALINTLALENSVHNDIVWSNTKDLPDMYGSIKALSWLQWLMKYCQNAKMVLKIDESVILNVPRVVKFAYKNKRAVNTIWGYKKENKEPYSFEYLSKDGYLMSHDVIPKLFYGGLKKISYITDENIYLTGKVAHMENIKLVSKPEFQGIKVTTNNFSGDPNSIKIPITECIYYRDHFIFLTSNNKNEWLFLLLTFSSCPKLNRKYP